MDYRLIERGTCRSKNTDSDRETIESDGETIESDRETIESDRETKMRK